jgi:hypothetical protein
MPSPVCGHRLLWHGFLLFLLGLLTGFAVPALTNPRMGLSAHLEGVMNGVFLVVLGLVRERLVLSARAVTALFWLALYVRHLRQLGHHAPGGPARDQPEHPHRRRRLQGPGVAGDPGGLWPDLALGRHRGRGRAGPVGSAHERTLSMSLDAAAGHPEAHGAEHLLLPGPWHRGRRHRHPVRAPRRGAARRARVRGDHAPEQASSRLYTATELVRLLDAAGLRFRSAHSGCSPGPFVTPDSPIGGRLGLLAVRD